MTHSIRQSIYTFLTGHGLITAIVGTNIFYGYAPSGTPSPFIVYQQIDSIPEHHQGGDSGMGRTRIQIDCYSTDADQTETLAHAVRRALDGYRDSIGSTFINAITLENRLDGMEGPSDGSEIRTFRSTLDFIVYHDETVSLNTTI